MAFLDRIDDELRPLLESLPEFDTGPLDLSVIAQFARAKPAAFPLVPHPEIDVLDDKVEGSGAVLRVFKPKVHDHAIPAFVYYHGGGYFTGNLEANDSLCQNFALSQNCAVIAVDYRKAPEAPYPAGFDDCYEALLWTAANPHFDKTRIVVGGISAGAGLAAGVAMKARDENGPTLAGQILAIPCIDHRFKTASSQMKVDVRVWNTSLARKAWAAYLKDITGDVPAYASPAVATDFVGLPPTFVSAEGEDILRDEAIEFAQSLMAASVPTDLRTYAGAYHGSFAFSPEAKISQQHFGDINAALSQFLAASS